MTAINQINYEGRAYEFHVITDAELASMRLATDAERVAVLNANPNDMDDRVGSFIREMQTRILNGWEVYPKEIGRAYAIVLAH